MANTDLYAVLECEHNATPEELKRSYRRLARQYHPDTNDDPAAESRFKEVSQAYEILSDPDRRANYDRFGSDVGAGGNPFGAGSVQDIFDMFFGGLGGHAQQRRGPQRHADEKHIAPDIGPVKLIGVEEPAGDADGHGHCANQQGARAPAAHLGYHVRGEGEGTLVNRRGHYCAPPLFSPPRASAGTSFNEAFWLNCKTRT